MLWMITGVIFTIFNLRIEMADKITKYLGVNHSPSFYIFLAIIFLLIIAMYFSVELSKKSVEIKNLIQEISILKKEF